MTFALSCGVMFVVTSFTSPVALTQQNGLTVKASTTVTSSYKHKKEKKKTRNTIFIVYIVYVYILVCGVLYMTLQWPSEKFVSIWSGAFVHFRGLFELAIKLKSLRKDKKKLRSLTS